ncbi:MAG: hypothetical protein WCA13_19235 [Terriglobales bacterium]
MTDNGLGDRALADHALADRALADRALADHWRESYVCETGKSMKAVQLVESQNRFLNDLF